MLLDRLGPIESKPLILSSLNDPVVHDEEILVRVRACGVCRSNLHMIEGDWAGRNIPSKLPIIPGHEIVGVVESTGRDVLGLKIEDRVGIQPLYYACGVCEYCLTGRENICPSKEITGQDVDGGFAEYIKIPFRFAYKVPERLSDAEAAPLFCPGVTAYRAV
ncbi:MAG: alcohol dehydrogenase catalytic domain-containing protein, partial [Candidatus Methylarchaceae archaeon HK01B]|nr:alcohol dehydrogenase catalytic domain-containing protein [Candidatus Methylarchaceae archaeon HK01B]